MPCCDAVVTGTCLTRHISHVLYRNLHIAENRVRHTQAQSGVFAGDPFPCPQNPPRFTPRGGSTPPPGTSPNATSDAGCRPFDLLKTKRLISPRKWPCDVLVTGRGRTQANSNG